MLARGPDRARRPFRQDLRPHPEHSLHLTHHLFGDDKNRGPALIDLSEFYKESWDCSTTNTRSRTTCR